MTTPKMHKSLRGHNSMKLHIQHFPDQAALVPVLGTLVTACLAEGIKTRAGASLVLSGGSTPGPLLDYLSTADVDWQKIRTSLADERFVPAQHSDRNSRQLRERLLRGKAAAASCIELVNGEDSAEQAAANASKNLDAVNGAYDAVVLGMGEDGHCASLFPGADNLEEGFSTAGEHRCVAIHPPRAPYPRISQTLGSLLASRFLALHIVGPAKWKRFCEALQDGGNTRFPVGRFIHQQQVPLHIFYAAKGDL